MRRRSGWSPATPRAQALLDDIETAYERRFAQFLRVATAIVGDAERGRDVVQDAFARAIAGRMDYRGDGPLEGWLWRTVTNVAYNHLRQAKPVVLEESLEGRVANRTPESPGGRAGAVREHVAELPERQRLVLFLRYYADLSYAQIAQVLDLRTGTVSATLAAAHGTLRSRLDGAS
jgi:RNA polymerase sigma factor (sigma-70 family)